MMRRRGAVKPPSSLRVELPMSMGPSIGPEPWKSVLCLSVPPKNGLEPLKKFEPLNGVIFMPSTKKMLNIA
jgi:hypothetical protein